MDILGKSDVPHVDLHDRLSFVGSSGGSEDASKAAPVTPLASPHPLASSVLLPSPPLPKQTTTSLTVPTKPSRESTSASHVHTYPGAQTLQELYDSLEPDEYGFFHILNREVDKIERFYTRREADATLKFEQLSGQMVTIKIKTQIHPETRVKRAEEKVETVERATTKLPGFDDPIQTDESSHEEDKQGLRRDLCEYYHNLELLKNFRVGTWKCAADSSWSTSAASTRR
jgi:hypothetical protein